jgi:gliding motility-associated-like protein
LLTTPKADFQYTPDSIQTPDGKATFINLSTGANPDSLKYEWTVENRTYTVKDPMHTFDKPGDYPVRLVVTHPVTGCTDTTTKIIRVAELVEKIYIPNIFTPNGDGANDFFSLTFVGFEKTELEIYDRWGTLVFSGANHWNGKYLNKGENCPAGVYFYVVKAYRWDGRIFHRTGNVTLTR